MAGPYPSRIAPALYAIAAAGLGAWMRGARFDDPFITYRFAENLAAGRGFVFNPGEAGALITTAPLYALLLAGLRRLGLDIPEASYWLGVLGVLGCALLLRALLHRHGRQLAGDVAGGGLVLMPLIWLTIGFETPVFLACVLASCALFGMGRPVAAGALLGASIGLRGDGMIVAMLAGAALVARREWRGLALAVCGGAVVYVPLATWLTIVFGSPIPTTLATKTAQSLSGLTGFYPFTTYAQGLGLLAAATASISPAAALALPLIGMGIHTLARHRPKVSAWLVVVAVWPVVHFVAYSALGVAPYVWYYAPMLPGAALLIGLGAERAIQRARVAGVLVSAAGAGGLFMVVLSVASVWTGAAPPPATDVAAKALPETKVFIYRQVGEWLRANTPPTATLGVTELGVMGYYADRDTVDFLGLTSAHYRDAIRRGDYLATLAREQPDYLALTAVNALYTENPQREAWFRALYAPVASFDDARFWGSPITVYRRAGRPITATIMLDADAHDLGEGWTLAGVTASTRAAAPGVPLMLRVRLRAPDHWAAARGTTYDLQIQPQLIAGNDGLPVTGRAIRVDLFGPGGDAWVDAGLLPQRDAPQGGYRVAVKWTHRGEVAHAGDIKVALSGTARPGSIFAPLAGGSGIGVIGRAIETCGSREVPLDMVWRGGDLDGRNLNAFVHLRSADGRTLAQADGPPRAGTYPTSVWSPDETIPDPRTLALPPMPAGEYVLVGGFYTLDTLERVPAPDSEYRTADGGVRFGTLHVRDCG